MQMTRKLGLAVSVFGLAALAAAVTAHAQSPLGIGTAEPSIMPNSSGLLAYVNDKQQAFYRALTGALKAMREDPARLWTLISLSFAYGVFHAAGPGHGKAVISSYMIANEVALRRGILLSFLSSMLQGLTAIGVVGLAYIVLRGTTVTMTDATRYLELASYLLVAGFGGWLLWRKVRARLTGADPHAHHDHELHDHEHHDHAYHGHAHHHHDHSHGHAHHNHDHAHDHHHGHAPHAALALASAAGSAHVARTHDRHDHDHDGHGHGHGHEHNHGHVASHEHHHHAPGEVCATCGHSHAPDPALIAGKDFSIREAWSAIIAVGLRPCSGALLVLSFSLLNGLYLGGILSVFAMAVGTAITVSALATAAVLAKGLALRFAGSSRADTVGFAIEIAGAAMVMLLGIVLFLAAVRA